MREVAVPAGAQFRRLWLLQVWPVGAVDGEGEAALGKGGARLVEHQAVRTVLVDDLQCEAH